MSFKALINYLLSGLLAVLMAMAITACGGGGGGGGGGDSGSVTAPPVDTPPAPAATATATAPSISTQPEKNSVVAGKTVTFSVVAGGIAPLSYQWKKNGAVIPGATSNPYTTPETTIADDGAEFSVVVSNNAGTVTSAVATLTVTSAPVAPSITGQPFAKPVTAGQTATFTVEATGTAPLRYQWKKGGTNIDGATGSSYTTPATLLTDSGTEYSVEVSNEAGTASSSVGILTVTTKPAITTQPAAKTVTVGQTASFTVEATGTPTLRYQWKKNGTTIDGATGSSYTTPATTDADIGTATYSVEVSNEQGTATSSVGILTVTKGPGITTEPVSRAVDPGATATFSVDATGTPAPTFQWQKNGANIPGATSNTYTTPATTASDNGAVFKVVVTNSAGTATSKEAVLSVNVPASITSGPANKAVVAGQTASFMVTAAGTGPFTYQWRKDGVNIGSSIESSDTTNTYTTTATVNGDDGAVFTVVVSNSASPAGVTSSSATLSVFATRYSYVPDTSGDFYAKTECVKDNLTGLVWEGKTATPATSRLGTSKYTNFDSTTSPQWPITGAYVNPTQTQIDASTNSIGYKNSVNTSALCGFTDWRLPTQNELLGILDTSQASVPKINPIWFPNTRAGFYWSSLPNVNSAYLAGTVDFFNGSVSSIIDRIDSQAVRLVRASQ